MTASTRLRDSTSVYRDPGSFRDPDGSVLHWDDRVFRYLRGEAAADFRALMSSGLLTELEKAGLAVTTREVDRSALPASDVIPADAVLLVEHERVPFLSYAYEWPFEMLRAAALSHLDMLELSLGKGYMVKDATSYNLQFAGARPVFIDIASFEPYREGLPWAGYSQFCRMFLNPLLLQALKRAPFQPWLRASLDGFDPADLSGLLSFRNKLRPSVFVNVVLQAWLTRRSGENSALLSEAAKRPVPEKATRRIISGLRKNVQGLRRPGGGRSVWKDYEKKLPYAAEALRFKEQFVEDAVAGRHPTVVWDLGCNLGHYSRIAARHAGYVVAMDNDEAAVGLAFESFRKDTGNVLPLVIDLMNPSPDQGWGQEERRGLAARGPADVALALALVHHLAISGNVPLPRIVDWLAKISRAVIVEFVPKKDPMVQRLLRTRKDVYPDYTIEAFQAALESRFRISDKAQVQGSQRVLFTAEAR